MTGFFAPPFATLSTLPEFLAVNAARMPDRPFLWARGEAGYAPLSWGETLRRVRACAAGLAALGVGPGDRVMLVAENRPEWLIADFAIMTAGGVTVPAYTTNTAADHLYILTDARPKAAIVSTPDLAARMLEAIARAGAPIPLIAIEPFAPQQAAFADIRTWDSLLAAHPTDFPQRGRDDLACMIYTSGTGGAPKGVMLSHDNIIADCEGAWACWRNLGFDKGDARFLSFLPLSHAYEHTVGECLPLILGAEIFYAESVERLAQNMLETKPTVVPAVPRLYEIMRAKILASLDKQPKWRRALFDAAVRIGSKRIDAPASLSLWERIADRALDVLVRRKVRQRFGGCLKAMVSGGAPLKPEVGAFFTALGAQILQGYGQTECAPVISVNRIPGAKMHTVGKPLAGIDVRIAETGEILARGRAVMKGYWNRPEETARAIDADGWLHTGDVGAFDADGHLTITDRMKDIIVLSGGDTISPQRVEGLLALEPEVGQVMVVGDRRPHLVALIVPDAAFAADFAARTHKEDGLAAMAADPDFLAAMRRAVARVNRTLRRGEQVRRFALIAEPFTTENGMLTPTLKIRRHAILAAHGDRLAELYR